MKEPFKIPDGFWIIIVLLFASLVYIRPKSEKKYSWFLFLGSMVAGIGVMYFIFTYGGF